jgi:hypothetical protein
MDPPGPDPLIRSFERHLYAENRSARTVTTYLIAVRQADAFLRDRGTQPGGRRIVALAARLVGGQDGAARLEEQNDAPVGNLSGEDMR